MSTCVWPRVNMPEPCTRGSRSISAAKRTHLVHLTAVHALLLVQQPAADNVFLGAVHALVDLGLLLGVDRVELLMHLLIDRLEALVADVLVVGIEGVP